MTNAQEFSIKVPSEDPESKEKAEWRKMAHRFGSIKICERQERWREELVCVPLYDQLQY
jgi:hypothetical protein